MKDVVVDEVIDEEIYQNFKKEVGKKDDYLTIEEYKKLRLNYVYHKNNELLKKQQSVFNTMERFRSRYAKKYLQSNALFI